MAADAGITSRLFSVVLGPARLHSALDGTGGMKKFLPHLLWVLGIVLLLIAAAKGSGAALPYQDPTPHLLAVQRGQLKTAWMIACGGGILLVAGIVWLIGQRLRRPFDVP